jgi:DNA-binding transcriptional MerR regulator
LAVSAPVSGSLRIGAFSRKVGVSAAVLRAWESRYGLFDPDRTNGGYRLYGAEEERRVTRMRALLARGMAAAESARVVLAEDGDRDPRPALAEAWRTFDAEAAQGALEALLATPEPEVVVARVVLPLLTTLPLGRRHFARRMVETQLLAHGTTWHEGEGPLALLGCGPGEHDTVHLLVLALSLRRRGWRLVYLGADTPVDVFADVAAELEPERIVVSFHDPSRAQGFSTPFEATIVCGDPLAAAASIGP